MKLKIFNITIAHNEEYILPNVKEIIAVDFFDAKHNFATEDVRNAALICRMED